MTHPLPTEHLSPSQLQAYISLESDISMEVQSSSFTALIEILNLLITDESISLACNSHTLRLAKDYKSRHLLPDTDTEIAQHSKRYQKAMNHLQATYEHSYPANKASIRHQYNAVLQSFGLSTDDTFDLDNRLSAIPSEVYKSSAMLDNIISTHKRTWSRYDDIDPLGHIYYATADSENLMKYLEMWTRTVQAIYNEMQKGLREIVDTEMHRIVSIKMQLKQHLVNYQHSQSDSELSQMRQKIGFIMADLPKDGYREFTDLVMFAVSNWEHATSKYLARYSKRFNSRNHQSMLINEAMQALRVVLRDIYTTGYIKVNISNNPLSYETQIVQVKELLEQLHYCVDWLNDESEYITWKRFYTELTSTDKSFVDVLTTLEESDQQLQLKYLAIQAWKDEAIKHGVPTADDSLAVFEVYKDLTTAINWSKVDLITESTKADYHLSFDGVHYILSNVNSRDDKSTLTISDKLLRTIKPMITLDYYGQSEQANHLTEAMVATKARFRTYQTRTLNIISCLDDIDTAHMIDLFSIKNINELKGESSTELIKGSILEKGKEKILLVYDDLLNIHHTAHYIWQRLVLQSMSSAGYKVISINTQDSLNHIDLDKHLATYLSTRYTISEKHSI